MTDKKTINIVAPVSSLSGRTRLSKLLKFINAADTHNVVHYGWLRQESERSCSDVDQGVETKFLVFGGGYAKFLTKILYLKWIWKSFLLSITLPKNSIVWALGFETAYPFLLLNFFKGHKVIFDDADRFSLAFGFTGVTQRAISRLERFASRQSAIHVVPGLARYNFHSDKFHILRNTPSKAEVLTAKEKYKTKFLSPKKKLTVNVNGWLGKDRGLPIISQVALKLIDNDDIDFIVLGKPDCADAKKLITLKNVRYYGRVSNAEALASYFVSDYVFTYYDPIMPINIYAESNKWGDAAMIGVGVLVNNEVKTALDLIERGVSPSISYSDVDSLCEYLILAAQNNEVRTSCKQAAESYGSEIAWYEDQLRAVFSKVGAI